MPDDYDLLVEYGETIVELKTEELGPGSNILGARQSVINLKPELAAQKQRVKEAGYRLNYLERQMALAKEREALAEKIYQQLIARRNEIARILVVPSPAKERDMDDAYKASLREEAGRDAVVSAPIHDEDDVHDDVRQADEEYLDENARLTRELFNAGDEIDGQTRALRDSAAETRRLQEGFWALTLEPWTGSSPGLKSFAKSHLESGRVQLSPDEHLALNNHLAEAFTKKGDS